MDQTTALLGALNAGKLPTTQQFDAFVDWVSEKDVGLFAAEAAAPAGPATAGIEEIRREEPGLEEEEEGKSNLNLIAKDVRELLDSYRSVLNDKNCAFSSFRHLCSSKLTKRKYPPPRL